jgi:DNA-nicking Smr family endonuclease
MNDTTTTPATAPDPARPQIPTGVFRMADLITDDGIGALDPSEQAFARAQMAEATAGEEQGEVTEPPVQEPQAEQPPVQQPPAQQTAPEAQQQPAPPAGPSLAELRAQQAAADKLIDEITAKYDDGEMTKEAFDKAIREQVRAQAQIEAKAAAAEQAEQAVMSSFYREAADFMTSVKLPPHLVPAFDDTIRRLEATPAGAALDNRQLLEAAYQTLAVAVSPTGVVLNPIPPKAGAKPGAPQPQKREMPAPNEGMDSIPPTLGGVPASLSDGVGSSAYSGLNGMLQTAAINKDSESYMRAEAALARMSPEDMDAWLQNG